MNREHRLKTLECAVCGATVQAGAEATRVLCQACAVAGRELPRARQLDLFDALEAPGDSRRGG